MKRKLCLTSRSRSGETTRIRSDDGDVEFVLAAGLQGLFVERVRLRRGAAQVVHSMVFADSQSFERWCDADTLRFENPLVHQKVKRCGANLLSRR